MTRLNVDQCAYILANSSEDSIFCQLAEECSELAQAVLKLRRARNASEYTAVSTYYAQQNLKEEMADVLLCMGMTNMKIDLQNAPEMNKEIEQIEVKKLARWYNRLKTMKEETQT